MMWIIFGISVLIFFAGCLYVAIDQFQADNERMIPYDDSGGYRPPMPPVRKWDNRLGSLASLHLSEDNDNGREESKGICD